MTPPDTRNQTTTFTGSALALPSLLAACSREGGDLGVRASDSEQVGGDLGEGERQRAGGRGSG